MVREWEYLLTGEYPISFWGKIGWEGWIWSKYFPMKKWDDYDKVLRALAGRTDNIVSKVMYGELELKPVAERTREYIFDILGIVE